VILALALFTVIWGVASLVPKALRRDEHGRAAGLTLDVLCLVWFAAFTLLAVALAPYLGDPSSIVFAYPGKLLPIALWALLGAALATPTAVVVALGPLRPKGWSWWRWTRQWAALAIFAALALTLAAWGFLGYSGW
jgi:hypothetical protein